MSGYSPAQEKHLAHLKNNAFELQNQEDIQNGRQTNTDHRVGFQGISDKVKSKPMSRYVIKEMISEGKIPETEEVVRTMHSGQLNVPSVIHNFYENLYKQKPCERFCQGNQNS